ncbi:trichohyalin isoform X1 [Kryptolebias marmoratus]|uniref:trichohyalin isoform X1 n=1 Tax=Kryptolebias marmoratus TaxID=37003 RepID=UPI0018ACB0E2|nr:trichohyalin isoform X1 [Kryptolebias marmoratus]
MSQEGSEAPDIYRLAELSQNLQIVKDQSWEKRREESEKIKIKIKSNKSSNSNQQFSGGHLTEQSRSPETVNHLQDQLRREVEEHIRGTKLGCRFDNESNQNSCVVFFLVLTEGKGSAEAVQERVGRIQQLKDALREETLKGGAVRERSQLSQMFNDKPQFGYNEAQERRRQLKEDHARLIHEEVAKMEEDLAREQPPAEGPQRELQVLSGQRRVLVLQMEALRVEAQQTERDLQDQHQRHQTELRRLRDESLQVFRAFRQVSEEQRKLSEGRYRSVLLEAVQDAVYLSAQNQQLQADNKRLRKALGEIKDALAARGDPAADLITPQE